MEYEHLDIYFERSMNRDMVVFSRKVLRINVTTITERRGQENDRKD